MRRLAQPRGSSMYKRARRSDGNSGRGEVGQAEGERQIDAHRAPSAGHSVGAERRCGGGGEAPPLRRGCPRGGRHEGGVAVAGEGEGRQVASTAREAAACGRRGAGARGEEWAEEKTIRTGKEAAAMPPKQRQTSVLR